MIIVGHRGARKEAPENTVESFVHAQQNGCLHFELDIQLSTDEELVVFHDSKLYRTTGVRGKVSNKPFSELKQLDARRDTPGWSKPCLIPNLQAVVDAASQTRHWQLEVKSNKHQNLMILAQRLEALLTHNNLFDTVTVTSCNRWFLRRLKQIFPAIQTGYVAEHRQPNPVKTAQHLGCQYLILNVQLANSLRVKQARDIGLHVSCWTVNCLDKMADLQEMGVNSIITDIPSAAIRHFC